MSQPNQKPMRTVWHSLLWKEWHEQKWKLVGLTVFAMAMLLYFWDGKLGLLSYAVATTLFCYSLVGLFLGIHCAASENGRGTMPFLQTLPVSMRKPASIKLLTSWILLMIPILVVILWAGCYFAWVRADQKIWDSMGQELHRFGLLGGTWGLSNWLVGLGIGGALCVSSLLLWSATLGLNRENEIHSAAVSFLAMAAIWFVIGAAGYYMDKWQWQNLLYVTVPIMAGAPGGPSVIKQLEIYQSIWPAVVVAIVAHAGVLAWFVHRFGRKTVRPARTLGESTTASHVTSLGPPRSSKLTAIVWKQLHETGPLALIAAAGVLVMTGAVWWLNPNVAIQNTPGEVLGMVTLWVGFMVTIVAGMGVFLEDVKPKIGIFWRSRPVNITQWFFVKYFTGLAVLIVTFGAMLLIAIALPGERSLFQSERAGAQIALLVLAMLLVYSISMASYCLGRHPIVSVLATLAILVSGVWCCEELSGWNQPSWSLTILMLIAGQLGATAIAWLAICNNEGWH